MDDAVEAFPLLGGVEHDGGQRGPIEGSVRGQHRRAEGFRDLGQARRAGCDDFAGQQVGVDEDGAVFGQAAGDGRLARADSAGQTHSQHVLDRMPLMGVLVL
ncbi:hypothetical protein GCM10029964_096200 [Kibdelosporangium lantanae]